jgi:2-polyprenyl-3-methyl-5-hydroxy-6-metoxy-1,4-benzoquinol methylase
MKKRFDEWKKNDDRVQLFFNATGFDLNKIDVPATLFLDVGCGYGRFSHTIAEAGYEVVGIDLSTTSIELAYDYVGKRENVHLVQCDLTKPPFKENTFDYVFSVGVLHHTPDARSSFASIVPYVRRGGRMAIWVYSPSAKRIDNKIRRITTKLPKAALFYLCLATPCLFSIYRYFKGIPQEKRGYWPTVMGWFDSWSPKFASVHEPAEVVRWFETHNFREIEALNYRTAVSGKKL